MAADVEHDSTTARSGRDRREIASWIGSVAAVAVAIGFVATMVGDDDPGARDTKRASKSSPTGAATGTITVGTGRSQAVATSFGELAVHPPRFVAGVGASKLNGNVHGIEDYVAPARQLVQVPITLYNAGDDPVHYDSSHFSLVTVGKNGRDSAPLESASSTLYPGRLQPSAAIDGELGFVIPRKGARLVLLFHEHRAGTYRVPLIGTGSHYRAKPGDVVEHATPATRAEHKHQSE